MPGLEGTEREDNDGRKAGLITANLLRPFLDCSKLPLFQLTQHFIDGIIELGRSADAEHSSPCRLDHPLDRVGKARNPGVKLEIEQGRALRFFIDERTGGHFCIDAQIGTEKNDGIGGRGRQLLIREFSQKFRRVAPLQRLH